MYKFFLMDYLLEKFIILYNNKIYDGFWYKFLKFGKKKKRYD